MEEFDRDTVNDYVRSKILRDFNASSLRSYSDISFNKNKTIYAIVGNWRAGKTTAAGYLIRALRKHEEFNNTKEYYHDTFNFGNVDESIQAFFAEIATMTNIQEFEKLGRVSTPNFDFGLNIGPLAMKVPFSDDVNVNQIRETIHDKLIESKSVYILVIDDIDRLTKEEQLQWLRTIELFGKFEKKILVIVPVNETILSKHVESSLLSKKYLDKILPNRLVIGVDVPYIKKTFFECHRPSVENKKRYAKYIFALAIRVSIAEHRRAKWNYSSWQLAFDAGEVSRVAKTLVEKLSYLSKRNDEGIGTVDISARYGEEGDIVLDSANEMRIIMNVESDNGAFYEYFLGTQFIQNKFSTSDRYYGADPDDRDAYTNRSLDQLTNYSELRNLFGDVLLKNGKMNYDAEFSDLPNAKISSYWLDVVYPVMKDIDSDKALGRYFTYGIIENEIISLSKVSYAEESDYFVNLIRQGDMAF